MALREVRLACAPLESGEDHLIPSEVTARQARGQPRVLTDGAAPSPLHRPQSRDCAAVELIARSGRWTERAAVVIRPIWFGKRPRFCSG
jgi:hypothetical protein